MKTFTTSNTLSFQCGRQAFCCRNWDICLSREVVEKIKSSPEKFCSEGESPSSLYSVTDENDSQYYAKAVLKGGRCAFLTGENTCKIFNYFGKEKGNPLCVEYPFFKFRLKERKTIVTCLSCTSSIQRLFEPPEIRIEEVPAAHSSESWSEVPYDILPFIYFNSLVKMTWEAYFTLERYLLSTLPADKESPWEYRLKLSMLQQHYYEEKETLMDEDRMIVFLKELPGMACQRSQVSLNVFFHFIHRKINLYHYAPFEEAVKNIIALENESGFDLNAPEFIQALSAWNGVFRNYLYIKIFSNPLNFSKGVEFCWHVLLFHLGFMKLFLFSLWREQKKIEAGDVKKAIQTVERHFLHDSKIFQFWGQGRRGERDFHPHSLESLII